MITYYALRLGLLLFPLFSLSQGYRACSVIGRLFWLLNAGARHTIEENLCHVLGPRAGRGELGRACRRIFVNLTKDYYDLLLVARLGREDVLRRVTVEGLERLDATRSPGTGVVAVFFHTAGFNLAAQSALLTGRHVCVVAEPLNPPRLRSFVNRMRSALGLELATPDRSGMRQMMRVLRADGTVVLAADRGITGTGVPVTLFGERVFLPAGAAALALRTGATIVPILISRCEDDRVRLIVGQRIEYARGRDFDATLRGITQAIASTFEEHVRQHPDQWVIARPIWRSTRPRQR